jgi:acetyltransferase-like isoleucine patch superfamily enzyme
MTRLGIYFWKIVSILYYSHRFGSLGTGSFIRRPLALINAKDITIGTDCFIRDGARLEIVRRPGLPAGQLIIGNNVSIEQDAHIVACDRVTIGNFVAIAPRCTIVDTTHPVGVEADGNRATQIDLARSFITIGDRVFIGANVIILPGVTIGENSIIGAGSLVSRDIPANCVAVGSPAVPVRHF